METKKLIHDVYNIVPYGKISEDYSSHKRFQIVSLFHVVCATYDTYEEAVRALPDWMLKYRDDRFIIRDANKFLKFEPDEIVHVIKGEEGFEVTDGYTIDEMYRYFHQLYLHFGFMGFPQELSFTVTKMKYKDLKKEQNGR